jgi:hypothetical protein
MINEAQPRTLEFESLQETLRRPQGNINTLVASANSVQTCLALSETAKAITSRGFVQKGEPFNRGADSEHRYTFYTRPLEDPLPALQLIVGEHNEQDHVTLELNSSPEKRNLYEFNTFGGIQSNEVGRTLDEYLASVRLGIKYHQKIQSRSS